MGIRHLARERAVQLLYAMEFAGPDEAIEDVERRFLAADKLHRRGWGPFARALARQAWAKREELDQAIRPTLKNWTLERLPIVERLCLRLALCELAYFPDIPLRVTINESIELARMFGNDESPVYINAVLDALARAFPQKDFHVRGDADPEQEPQPDSQAVLSLAEVVPEAAQDAPQNTSQNAPLASGGPDDSTRKDA
jgi:N utilization substance protein B